jgi:hypothetical protein
MALGLCFLVPSLPNPPAPLVLVHVLWPPISFPLSQALSCSVYTSCHSDALQLRAGNATHCQSLYFHPVLLPGSTFAHCVSIQMCSRCIRCLKLDIWCVRCSLPLLLPTLLCLTWQLWCRLILTTCIQASTFKTGWWLPHAISIWATIVSHLDYVMAFQHLDFLFAPCPPFSTNCGPFKAKVRLCHPS